MSRVSIGKRIERVRAHYRPKESLAGRIDRLSPEHREYVQSWQSYNAAIISRTTVRDGPGEAYRRWINGDLPQLHELQQEIVHALWPEWPDADSDEPSRIYNQIIGD